MILPPLRNVIKKHGLQAKKSLGQNFLLDLNLTRRIAREAGVGPDVTVYEVGPGPGGLTRSLLEEGAEKVIAVEKDWRCIEALAEISQAYPGRLEVIEEDARKIDECALFAESLSKSKRVIAVANLPYNVSTVLLTRWLASDPWPPWFSSLTLMFQKEVADRLVAQVGDKSYGRLSILANWRTQPRRLFDLPPQAFVPAPKVTSTVVTFIVRDKPLAEADCTILQQVTAAAFGQRRKMLRSSLKTLDVDTVALMEMCDINPELRAEALDVDGFCTLARGVEALRGRFKN